MAVAIAAPVVGLAGKTSANEVDDAARGVFTEQTRYRVCKIFYDPYDEAYLNGLIQQGKDRPGGITDTYYYAARKMLHDAFDNGCPSLFFSLSEIVAGERYSSSHNKEAYYLITGIRE